MNKLAYNFWLKLFLIFLFSRKFCPEMSSLLSRSLLKLIIMDSKALSGLLPRQHHCSSGDKGERHIFNGHKSSPMFEMEKQIQLPELEEGEVLVKVRAATICISDIHTVTGARIEPTPR